MKITFERAEAADAEMLVTVQIAAFHSDAELYPDANVIGPPGYDSVLATRKRIQTLDFYKIIADGQISGNMAVVDKGEGHFYLDMICVDPAYHSRGIGTQAMQFIERTYPATKWTLYTPKWATRNHHFYEKLGYVKVGEEEHPEITLFAYEKRL